MRVLGIETSCDETGIAIYDSDRGVIADALHSQVDLHKVYGGVVPELASRDHVGRVIPLVKEALEEAHCSGQDLDGVAYTAGPGLVGALLVGAATGRSLAYAWGIPAVAVHHMEAHLLTPMLEEDAPVFPFLALLVSGGHTQMMQVNKVGDYVLLGESLDDAAGEAFDKTAKLLGLDYPGGAAMSAMVDMDGDECSISMRAKSRPEALRRVRMAGLRTMLIQVPIWTSPLSTAVLMGLVFMLCACVGGGF